MKTETINLKTNMGNENILEHIFREIRLLRNEVSLLIPSEDIKEYAHPVRIRNSYKKALKQYPISI